MDCCGEILELQHPEAVKIHKLKIHMQAVYMKEERLHHGQCQRRLIVRGYTSGNCMKERCTLMPVAAITDASSLYGGAWCLVTCVGRGRTLNKRPWAATATKGHCGSSSPLLVLFWQDHGRRHWQIRWKVLLSLKKKDSCLTQDLYLSPDTMWDDKLAKTNPRALSFVPL